MGIVCSNDDTGSWYSKDNEGNSNTAAGRSEYLDVTFQSGRISNGPSYGRPGDAYATPRGKSEITNATASLERVLVPFTNGTVFFGSAEKS